MSTEVESKAASDDWSVHPPSDRGWSWKKTGILIAFAFAVHLALIFIFGAKKFPARKVPTRVPHFRLAANNPELIALDDPTLFALPHVQDFVPAVWRNLKGVALPSFGWTEPPPFLPPQTNSLGAIFNEFMQTNQFAAIKLNLKPEPRLSAAIVPAVSILPTHSTMRVTGDLASRRLLNPIEVPSLTYNDVIAPSRVQVLVNASGNVVSDVLLDGSAYDMADQYDPADQLALKLARTAQFSPTNRLTFGELIFHWHTKPESVTATNAPASAP